MSMFSSYSRLNTIVPVQTIKPQPPTHNQLKKAEEILEAVKERNKENYF